MKSHKAAVTKAFNAHHNMKGPMSSTHSSTPKNNMIKHPKMKARMAHK